VDYAVSVFSSELSFVVALNYVWKALRCFKHFVKTGFYSSPVVSRATDKRTTYRENSKVFATYLLQLISEMFVHLKYFSKTQTLCLWKVRGPHQAPTVLVAM